MTENQTEATSSANGAELLVAEEEYLTSGVHIGTQHKTADMKPFIFRVRNDGLFVLDVAKTDEAVRQVAEYLKNFDANRILFVSQRQYGQTPVKQAATVLGSTAIAGRFMPGTLTNPVTPNYMEPEVLVLTDPLGDGQAMREAMNIGIPIVGLCDSNNETKNLKHVIPGNNKGRRSLALVYYLLTKEMMKLKGQEFDMEIEDFEAQL
jgi:small subunit ribosomal protein S2